MLTRRSSFFLVAAMAAFFAVRAPASAQSDAATAFIHDFGTRLVAVVNGGGPLAQKEQQLLPLIDQNVDVDAIARFTLGRFVKEATPQQLAEFTQLFHRVLVENITSKIGQYRGVSFQMLNSSARGGDTMVGTVVQRPNNAPNNVQWVVSTASGAPKIIDVVAEGTSLRLTQRSDYASFLARNGNSVDALIQAMRKQLAALQANNS